jgi:hypothetical protein
MNLQADKRPDKNCDAAIVVLGRDGDAVLVECHGCLTLHLVWLLRGERQLMDLARQSSRTVGSRLG